MAQPVLPDPHERPRLAGNPNQPRLVEPHDLVPPPGPDAPPPQPDHEAPLPEPEDRALLPEPPDRPVTGPRRPPAFRGRRPAGDNYPGGQTSPLPPRGAGWTIISYLIAGMIAYGAIGWLVSRAVHETAIFPVGMLFGLGVSLGLVIYRYGRSSSTNNEHAKETLREESAGDR